MIPNFHSLHPGERLDLSGLTAPPVFHLVHARPSTRLRMPAGWLSIWTALHGSVEMSSDRGTWTLPHGELLIAQEGAVEADHDAQAVCLVLAAPGAVWRALAESSGCASEPLIGQGTCARSVRREFVHLARCARDGDVVRAHAAARAFVQALNQVQSALRALAERCNGRTPQRRLSTLQRLLRVRQLIERSESPLDLSALAGNANYSPWHLMRMYRDVFGETPSAHLARLRLVRAWSLVRGTTLPVCDITERLGFESQSAFCRAFKSAYGMTTTQARNASGTSLAFKQEADGIAQRPTGAKRLQPAGKAPLSPRPSHVRPRKRHAPLPQSALR